MASNVRNTADLRQMLLDVIDDVRRGKVDPKEAKAISSLASQVLTSAKLDLDVRKAGVTENTTAITHTILTLGTSQIGSSSEPEENKEATLKDKIVEFKKQKKTLGAIQDILNPQTQEQRKEISTIFMNIK